LICWCCSEIFEICHVSKGFIVLSSFILLALRGRTLSFYSIYVRTNFFISDISTKIFQLFALNVLREQGRYRVIVSSASRAHFKEQLLLLVIRITSTQMCNNTGNVRVT
jgi:hypothetical protein